MYPSILVESRTSFFSEIHMYLTNCPSTIIHIQHIQSWNKPVRHLTNSLCKRLHVWLCSGAREGERHASEGQFPQNEHKVVPHTYLSWFSTTVSRFFWEYVYITIYIYVWLHMSYIYR